MNFFDPGQIHSTPVSLVGESGIGKSIADNNLAFAERRGDTLTEMLHPGGGVQVQLSHGLNPDIFRREQDLPDLLPYSGPARLTGKQKRPMKAFQERCQEADLGGLAAPFDSFEGNKKAQISPAFRIKKIIPELGPFSKLRELSNSFPYPTVIVVREPGGVERGQHRLEKTLTEDPTSSPLKESRRWRDSSRLIHGRKTAS
jgi:hypothetical protein